MSNVGDHGRALAAARRIVESTCEMCGKPIRGTRKRKYCSHACAQRAYYRRQTRRAEPVGEDEAAT